MLLTDPLLLSSYVGPAGLLELSQDNSEAMERGCPRQRGTWAAVRGDWLMRGQRGGQG